MAGAPLDQARAATRAFLDQLRAADEIMLVGVSSEVETLSPLSTDRAGPQAAVDAMTPWGSTKLHDAILQAMDRIDAARGRRALVILSDGQDRGSRARADEVIDRVRRANVLVYPVVLGERNSPLLAQLAAFSGGRAAWIRRSADIVAVFTDIAQELRHQYLIGFAPVEPEAAATWRRITVEVPGRQLRVRARR
jgi:Ca-activated chloride channel family protein